MNFLFYVMLICFLLISVFLSLVILGQESKSMGLGASFGGDAGESVFGTSTAQVLKKITVYLAFLFFAFCFFLGLFVSAKNAPSLIPVQHEQMIEEGEFDES